MIKLVEDEVREYFGLKSEVVYLKGGKMKYHTDSGAIYGLGLVGAVVYYVQHASSLGAGIIGVVKAIFWPGVVLYKVLELLKM